MSTNSSGSIENIRKKVTHTHELISTAYHEAGHTIYGLLHHMKVDMVHIFEDKKSKRICGFTHFNYPIAIEVEDSELSKELMKSDICVNYAGLVAEKYHFKNVSGSDKFPGFWKNGSSSDTMAAAVLIKQLATPGRKRYNLKNKLIKKTHYEIQQHWEAVVLVSHALFQRKRLYFSDLKEILTKKSENKEFWKAQFNNIDYIFENGEDLDEKSLKSILCR